jgi:TRAP-type C4-dicarboxylate transport system permease large subunit
MLFSGLSGSVNADAAAIGSVTIPMMVNAGYRKPWAAAIVTASAGTGILIPPSIMMIILGYSREYFDQAAFSCLNPPCWPAWSDESCDHFLCE